MIRLVDLNTSDSEYGIYASNSEYMSKALTIKAGYCDTKPSSRDNAEVPSATSSSWQSKSASSPKSKNCFRTSTDYEKAWNRLEDFNRRFPADMQKSILQMAIQGKLVEQRPEEGTGEELYRQIQAEKQAADQGGQDQKRKAPAGDCGG